MVAPSPPREAAVVWTPSVRVRRAAPQRPATKKGAAGYDH